MKICLPVLRTQLSKQQRNMNDLQLFECNNLVIGYSSPLATGINMKIPRGKIMFIKGKNGSGKSTLIHTLLGKLKPLDGNFKWLVERSSISYLPQITNPNSSFSFTIKEILDLYEIDENIRKKLPLDLEKKKWINASGGEKQKVMLLSRLTKDTKVLILDEPFNHLDQDSVKSVSDLLINIIKENQLGVLLVSHLDIELPEGLGQILELKQ